MTEEPRRLPTHHASLAWRARYAHRPHIGGGERDRTDDLLLAKQVLSQLSYTPTEICIANLADSK